LIILFFMNTTNSLTEGSFLSSQYLNPVYWFDKGYAFFKILFKIITSSELKGALFTLMFLAATFFLTVISYSLIRIFEIRKKEHAHHHHKIEEYAHYLKEREKKKEEGENVSKNNRWTKTLTYLFSDSSSDWKLAIIEADAMLDTLMGELGFKGENLGEKLKSANQETFRNLTTAWEVHNIRNRIAHEGLSYDISQHEAKRTIALYERIFSEYGYI